MSIKFWLNISDIGYRAPPGHTHAGQYGVGLKVNVVSDSQPLFYVLLIFTCAPQLPVPWGRCMKCVSVAKVLNQAAFYSLM